MNPETFKQLILSCRRSKQRFIKVPCDWNPTRVKHPENTGFCFTDASAWEFIADRLEAQHPYTEILLDNPPGALAVVMKIQLMSGDPLLYVKIQLGAGNKAIGRSFHYSDHY